ncbi:MAG TPA: beta-propeller fold lactonase family protein [Acidobacteriaceae bacterium]|nr:beta-propeller fold lactonase family protein [Acidobacteriaceae bacterium]
MSCPVVTCDNSSKETTVYPLRRAARRIAARGCAVLCCAGLSLSAVLLLTGCHNFFICQKASCPSGGGGSTTSDWAYVSNATAGSTDISAYDIGNGSLAAISGSPYNIGFAPVAMSVSPGNAFLYVASIPGAVNPGIYMFAINSSSGALSTANGGNVLISTQVSSMDISPDGNFLFVVDALANALTEYQINPTTGLLSLASSFPLLPGAICAASGSPVIQQCTVKVAPSGQFVVAALGTAGTIIYPYSSASGITSTTATVISSGSTKNNPTGDYSVALDKSNLLYIARTTALAVYALDANGNATLKSTATYSSGVNPRSVALSTNYSNVYTANVGAGNISGYSINSTTGALATLSGSPFSAPANVSAIAADKSGKYMVAVGYNGTSGIQLFTIGTTGALTLATSAGTGTSPDFPAILALSH